MKFHIQEVHGVPFAVFENETPSRGSLLGAFLEEASSDIQDFLNEIEKAKSGEEVPAGYTCNGVDVSFYPDRAVIEELYPAAGAEAEPEKTELPLEQARHLLLDWQAALTEWRAQRQ